MFINTLLFASVVAYEVYCKLTFLYSGQQFNARDDKKKSIKYEGLNFITLVIMYFVVKA